MPQTRLGRAQVIVANIFQDTDDSTYVRRNADIVELASIVTEKAPMKGDTAMWISENLQLMDLLFHGDSTYPGLDSVFDDPKAPANFKASTIRLLAVLAEHVRPDLFAEWIFQRILFSTSSTLPEKERERYKERSTCLLDTLRLVVENSTNNAMLHRQLATLIPYILSNLMTVLDTISSSEQIPSILKILLAIAVGHPQLVDTSFQDIVDLLMGWHTDPNVSIMVHTAIEEFYLKMRNFWSTRMPFAFDLLHHLIIDIQTSNDSLKSSSVSQKDKQETTKAMKAYFACFHSIVRAISTYITDLEDPVSLAVGAQFDEIRTNMMECIWQVIDASTPPDIGKKSIMTMIELAEIRKSTYQPLQWTMYTIIIKQKSSFESYELLKIFGRAAKAWIPNIDLNILEAMLDAQHSPIIQLYFQEGRANIKSAARSFLQILLAHCHDRAMQEKVVHGYFEEVETCASQLKEYLCPASNSNVHVPPDDSNNGEDDIKRILSKSFDTAKVSNTRTTLTFFAYILLAVSISWPQYHQACINRVVSGIESGWECACENIACELLAVTREFYASQGYFAHPLQSDKFQAMCSLLAKSVGRWVLLSDKSKRLIISWVRDVTVATEASQHAHSSIDDVIIDLFAAQESEDNVVTLKLVLGILQGVERLQLSAKVMGSLYPTLERSLRDPDEKISSLASSILVNITPWLAVSKIVRQRCYEQKIQKKIMASPHTGNFRPAHFEQVMKFLSMEEYLPKVDQSITNSLIDDWCQRLFHHCETTASIQETIKVAHFPNDDISSLDKNTDMLLYWVIWEATRYCMLSRMRTPCGGPQQTFSALERTLDKLLTKVNSQHNGHNLVPLKYLVLLIDRLELQIFNASSGNATGAMPSAPRSSIIFFRANKKTCRDWFAHIRGKVIAAAAVLCDNHMIIRQAWVSLSEKEHHLNSCSSTESTDLIADMDRTVAILVEALIRIKAVEVLNGLQKWYHSTAELATKKQAGNIPDRNTGSLLFAPEQAKKWFSIAIMYARGHYELAIKEYKMFRTSLSDGNFIPEWSTTLDNPAVDYLTSVEDYQTLKELLLCGKKTVDVFGIDMLNDMLRTYVQDTNSKTTLGSQLSPSSFEIWIEHMNVQQCMYFARLKYFRNHIISLSTRLSKPTSSERKRIIHSLLSDKLAMAVQANNYLKWNAQSEMSLIALDASGQAKALSGWISSYNHRFKKSDLEQVHKDPTHWARLGHYLRTMDPSHEQSLINISAWIKASVITARVCRWNKNVVEANSIIAAILAQHPSCPEALFERAKLLESSQEYTKAAAIYGQLVHESTSSDPELTKDMRARAAVGMTKLCKRRHWQTACSLLQEFNADIICGNETDYSHAITTLYESACQFAPEWPKAWFLYGSHCYRYGWQILEDIKSGRGAIQVTQETVEDVQTIVKEGMESKHSSKDVTMLCNIFTHASQSWNLEDNSKSGDFEDDIRAAYPTVSDLTINALVQSFAKVQSAIVVSFSRATTAYRQYLKVEQYEHVETNSAPSMNITCTLRLMRLLIKYGTCLRSQFNALIATDSIKSWKLIIPQLFSRLNQPASYARDVIWEILAKITRESPKNVIYEIIVGCNSPKTSAESKQLLERMASQLSVKDAQMLLSIKKMIEEMEKITVLWEEKWINKIAMLQFDATERLQRFEKELSRMKSTSSSDVEQGSKALSDVYDAILLPVVVSIRDLIKETIGNGSHTPHEDWFQNSFGGRIRQAFTSLEKPTNWKNYRQGWDCFQKLHRELMKETAKLRILKLSQLSPYLAQIKGTDIPIPGIQDPNDECTIDSFVEEIITLPTKTRPKKVNLKGSDNKIYPFLFKGLEDLHLDERVMQLLGTVNNLVEGDMNGCEAGMKARVFAVIPISDHSGMIQWVQDASPLFALYKRWQQRENAAMIMTAAEKQVPEKHSTVITRPTEMFMEKISSALKREGLPVTASRRKWPKEVLKNVFLELESETPNDLLSKEVWCNSTTAQDWWRRACSLGRSMAVMSVIGYIIGLGDRHLDNTMVDFGSGEVVHIDFNVCFEKGKRLRVPELVPFRLTQNMVHALGLTGPDGIFKIAAEQVLSVLQRHKEVLVTLLDAFVYDPLFDWSTEVEENQKKQMMDLQANFGLLSNRLDEVKQQLQDEERLIMYLLETLCVQLETETVTEESTATLSVQQDMDDTSNEVNYSVEDLKQILVDVMPLLESIDIMQVEVDNELKIGQQNVKIILASIAKLDESIPSLISSSLTDEADTKNVQQSKERRIEECMLIMTTVRELFSAIKALEGYGTDVKAGQTDIMQITNALQQMNISKASSDEDAMAASRGAFDEGGADSHAVFAGDGKFSDFDVTDALDEDTNVDGLVIPPSETTKPDQESKSVDVEKKTERRNHHAVGILRRIRSKLEGIDFGHRQAMSVPEHVSLMISEATSVDNLSMMYEGWTSWV
ncbi:hypothetical protein K450DRAFT_262519 [Umbelopsis ramanniana AG]|uniref:non-specific serine/threonine protein kinase n=1 Tax=Umbelopsis ramanniana AG TaxID=1314678 RepID=A0AAD5E082_UMBRA|nr:uncharacterized protein K450DRAFT_262519 [Umbelopsis ramanniana AG]KAI8575271.1 hypothetical protein K450DRAFT_262519 [Umbelopsis ramanniana AG]